MPGINGFAAAIWNPDPRAGELQRHQPDLAGAAQGQVPRRHVPDPVRRPAGSTAGGAARSCSRAVRSSRSSRRPSSRISSRTNVDHQLTAANRFSGKFFFSNQPSRDPLANGNALTRYEREDTTYQRTFSLTDLHVFSPSVAERVPRRVLPEPQRQRSGRLLHQRRVRDPEPASTPQVPDLTPARHPRRPGRRRPACRFGTPGRRHAHLRPADDVHDRQHADAAARGRHSIRAGGELRRHHLDGDLREGQNRRHNFRSWFDFLTVGYRNPSDGNRARQISDSSLTYGETARDLPDDRRERVRRRGLEDSPRTSR